MLSYLLILFCSLQLVFADADSSEGEKYGTNLVELKNSSVCQRGLSKECIEAYLKLRNEATKKKGSVDYVSKVAGASFHFIGDIENEFSGGRTIFGMKYQNDVVHEALNRYKKDFSPNDETVNRIRNWCQTVVSILAVTARELKNGKFSSESESQNKTDLIEYYKKTRLKDGVACPEALTLSEEPLSI